MSYQNPIEVIQTQMRNMIEGEIYKAVMGIGVTVDKDELMKALAYDRNQYQKGYKDRDDQIIRCKDCRWGEPTKNAFGEDSIICGNDDTYIDRYITVPADWFCPDGERRE